ncbi:hypothetical protein BaRGS_00006562, partial [Batillaria attramentaria]
DLPPLSSPTTTFYLNPKHPPLTHNHLRRHTQRSTSVNRGPPLPSPPRQTTFYVKPPNTHPSPTTTFDDIHNVLLPSIEDLPPLSSRQPPSTLNPQTPTPHPQPPSTTYTTFLLPSIEDLPPLSSPTTTFYVKPPNTHPSPTTTFDDIPTFYFRQ